MYWIKQRTLIQGLQAKDNLSTFYATHVAKLIKVCDIAMHTMKSQYLRLAVELKNALQNQTLAFNFQWRSIIYWAHHITNPTLLGQVSHTCWDMKLQMKRTKIEINHERWIFVWVIERFSTSFQSEKDAVQGDKSLNCLITTCLERPKHYFHLGVEQENDRLQISSFSPNMPPTGTIFPCWRIH